MKKLTFAIIALLGMGFGASAQGVAATAMTDQTVTVTIPEVTLVALNATTAVTQTFTHSGIAGDPIMKPMANSSYNLVYSSIKKSEGMAGNTRKITVEVDKASSGVDFVVMAGTPSGTGTVGSGSSQTFTAAGSKDLITGIGSCYTGTAANAGSLITYSTDVTSGGYANLVAGATAVKVTYTLAD